MGAFLISNNGRSKRKKSNPISEINVTPLVDVMLVLLIIFMITSPMLVAGIKVDLPETTASPATGQDEPIAITIDSKGDVYIQDTKISHENLASKLKAITHEKYETRIFVRGDKVVGYGKIIEVIGAINQAGFNKVALVTNIKNDSQGR